MSLTVLLAFAFLLAAASLLLAETASPAAAALAATPAPRPTPQRAPIPIRKAHVPPVIDGRLDDACWKDAVGTPVHFRHADTSGQPISSNPMTACFAWDEHYLYIGYRVTIDVPRTLGTGLMQGPPDNRREGVKLWELDKGPTDMVEFFLHTGDSRFFWEVHHNANNQFNDIFCVVPDPSWPVAQLATARLGVILNMEEYMHDEDDYTVAMAAAPAPSGKGYTGELRLPWLAVGAPLSRRTTIPLPPEVKPHKWPHVAAGPWQMEGFEMRILSVIQSSVLPDRYHRSNVYTGKPWMHQDADCWLPYRLVP